MSNHIFLSYKYHDKDGHILPDYYLARDLYERLKALGLSVFFSDETLLSQARADYKRIIDTQLDESTMLIVVSTSPEHCNSNWVRYEWDSFYNDILSERKKGELLSYLDTDNIGSFPRTIRSLQVFNKKNNEIDQLIEFVKNYFGVVNSAPSKRLQTKGSSYNYDVTYELGDEKKRLEIQAKVESKNDVEYISQLSFDNKDVYYVLDVGCSEGTLTFDVFDKLGEKYHVLGVDKFKDCVDSFNASAPARMCAELLDFEDDDWEEQLCNLMQKHNITKFDLVYCSLSLHHMSNSARIVKKLWNYININGYIYIRTCDDALKIAYPHEDVIQEIIKKTASVSRVSDRYHGRKIYSILYKAKFKRIQIKSFLIDTCDKDIDERYALFYSAFVWRKNYFKNQLNSAKSTSEVNAAMKEYNDVMILLDNIENLFMDRSFYFGYYVTVAIAQKESFFL